MLKGFEDITADLSEYEEMVLVPLFLRGFRDKIGKEKAVTNKEIVRNLTDKKYKISDARVRKIINHIRRNDLISGLIATSSGYYVTNDKQELLDYIDSLKGRESEIRRIRKSIENYLEKL